LANFDVAFTRRNTGSDGEDREEITFVPTIGYAKQADIVAKFFKKGEFSLVPVTDMLLDRQAGLARVA